MHDDHRSVTEGGDASRLHQVALLLAIITVAAVGVLLFRPWLVSSQLGGSDLNRYRPTSDGEARLFIIYDADGKIREWTSHHDLRLAPSSAITTGLRPAQRVALGKHWSSSESIDEVFDTLLAKLPREGALIESRMRSVSATGQVDGVNSIMLRTETGDYSVGSESPAHSIELTYEPPLLTFPVPVQYGATLDQTGVQKIGGVVNSYQQCVHVVGLETIRNEAGEFADCLKIATRIEFKPADKPSRIERFVAWYRPELGLVEFRRSNDDEKLIERGVLVSGPGFVKRELLPPAVKTSTATSTPDPTVDRWELHSFGKVQSSYDAAAGTIAPLWIDTDPPLLVAAAQEGDLIALSTDASNGAQAWQFHPGGTVLGPPCWDQRRACLYFGATDKRLYAIDARGMFRWSFRAADNVVTRPVIVADRVIFGSDSGQIYALNAIDGVLAWEFAAPSPIASSPVIHGTHVIFGCDDGGLYALDAEHGTLVWNASGSSPIDAPLTIDGDHVLAVNHGDELFAFDATDGRQVWSTRIGFDCRSAPEVLNERVLVVAGGRLVAFDRTTGARLWRTEDHQLVGPAVSVGQAVFVASERGEVYQFDTDGRSVRDWHPAANETTLATDAKICRGLVVGGDALWLIDTRGGIHRLGPPPTGPRALRQQWSKRVSEAPFQSRSVNATPVIYRDEIVVVDEGTHLFRLNATTGNVTPSGRINTAGGSVSADMTIDGDLLWANVGSTLHAVQLPGGQPVWSHKAGFSIRPVEIVGDTVYWLSQLGEHRADGKTGLLLALDRQTGKVRWEQPVDTPVAAGGLVVAGDRLLVSTPPSAYGLVDGTLRWQTDKVRGTIGGLGLSQSGELMFVGNVNDQTGTGGVAALRVADGTVVWQASVGAAVPNPMERVWSTDELVIVPLWNGAIVALAVTDGTERWRYQPPIARRGGITVHEHAIWFMQQNTEVVGLAVESGQPRARYAWNVNLRSASGFAPRPLSFGKHVIAPFAWSVMSFADVE